MLQCLAIFLPIVTRWNTLISILRAVLCALQSMRLNTPLSCLTYPPLAVLKAELWIGCSSSTAETKGGVRAVCSGQTCLLGIYLYCIGLIEFCLDWLEFTFEPVCLDSNSRDFRVAENSGLLTPCRQNSWIAQSCRGIPSSPLPAFLSFTPALGVPCLPCAGSSSASIP